MILNEPVQASEERRYKSNKEIIKKKILRLFLMVGVEHYKAIADVIIQSFTDKIPDETTIHFMAYYSMLCEHR